jgi:hypothetical protein
MSDVLGADREPAGLPRCACASSAIWHDPHLYLARRLPRHLFDAARGRAAVAPYSVSAWGGCLPMARRLSSGRRLA